MRIGVISDTHGLLRPEALAALAGCDHIVHAGDIGRPEILERLREIAPLTVVRGNNDTAGWAVSIPEAITLQLGALRLHVVHDLKTLAIDLVAEDIDVVVSGHSHKPNVERGDGVLYVNPGSAGPRRFSLPIAVAELVVEGSEVSARIVDVG